MDIKQWQQLIHQQREFIQQQQEGMSVLVLQGFVLHVLISGVRKPHETLRVIQEQSALLPPRSK